MGDVYIDASHKTFKAEASLANSQYYLVKLGTNHNEVNLPTADSDIPIGVNTGKAPINESASIRLLNSCGTAFMVASAAITEGDEVCMAEVATAAGKIRTMTGIAAGTYYVVGRALEAATADGDIIEVLLIPAVQRVVV
uniref:Uncharacterized protein n=1 Tax=viral metagenome TaxID=1070528 RepID=A0A6M3ISE1_9ZZZZ